MTQDTSFFNNSKTDDVSNQSQSVINLSNDAITSISNSLKITSWNLAAEKMYGYTPEEIIGKPIEVLFPQSRKYEIKKMYVRKNNTQNENKYIEYETERLKKNGTILQVEITVSPIKNNLNQFIGYSIIHRDITERKKIDELKKAFLSTASHELKTPITSIKLLVQMHKLRCDKLSHDPVITRELESIDSELNRLTKLINDLLDISRFDSGKTTLQLEYLDITSIVHEAIEKIRLIYPHNSIYFQPTSSILTAVDKTRIEQVITNLLINAIKHSQSDQPIEVNIRPNAKSIKVSVRDHGIGIPKNKISEVFERFYQVKNTGEGFGLGLYISKSIIDLHKGKIGVISKEGQGSTFYFSLPHRSI